MTNFEYYKDEIKKFSEHRYLEDILFQIASEHGYKLSRDKSNYVNLLDWFLEEHETSIKLKQWEYDCLQIIVNGGYIGNLKFNELACYSFKKKGHFKGVSNTSMNIKDILNNYEIVSDNYWDGD